MSEEISIGGQVSGNTLTLNLPIFKSNIDGWELRTDEPEIILKTNTDDIKLNDVVGLNDAKRMLERRLKIYLEFKGKMSRTLSKGILLYGYPGTGKTMLVKAVMGSMDTTKVLSVIADESDFTGQSHNTTLLVKNYFKFLRAKAKGRDILLLLDEAEGIIGEKNGKSVINDKRVQQILREIDGIEDDNKNIFILATTNHPARLEPAMLRSGRIDYHIRVDMPDESERYQLIKQYCGSIPGITDTHMSAILLGTPDWTGANYSQLGAELEMEYLISKKLTDTTILSIVDQIQKHSKRNFKKFEMEYKEYMSHIEE